jgi:hypothetical protein
VYDLGVFPRLSPLFVAASMVAVSAFGWDDSGHMTIAAIAYQHLTPKAKAEAEELLKIGATDRNNDFLTSACWADDIRRDRHETSTWHYIDIHFRADGKPSTNKPDAENVVWAIDKFEHVLADPSQPEANRAEALRFILHFVGDIHQPLHATSRDTDQLPEGDAGGNKFPIAPPAIVIDDRPPRNLHSLWDLGCGIFPYVPRNFRPLDPAGRQQIEAIADKVEQADPEKSLPQRKDLNPQDWANESFTVAKDFVYSLQEGSSPSREYLLKGQVICEKRAALAGYRLAEVLNKLLK